MNTYAIYLDGGFHDVVRTRATAEQTRLWFARHLDGEIQVFDWSRRRKPT